MVAGEEARSSGCHPRLARTSVDCESLGRPSNLHLGDIIHLILRCQGVGVFRKESRHGSEGGGSSDSSHGGEGGGSHLQGLRIAGRKTTAGVQGSPPTDG